MSNAVNLEVAPHSVREAREFRKFVAWFRLFVLGFFMAASGVFLLAGEGDAPRLAAVFMAAGGLLTVISWRNLGPLLKDNNAVSASETGAKPPGLAGAASKSSGAPQVASLV